MASGGFRWPYMVTGWSHGLMASGWAIEDHAWSMLVLSLWYCIIQQITVIVTVTNSFIFQSKIQCFFRFEALPLPSRPLHPTTVTPIFNNTVFLSFLKRYRYRPITVPKN